MRALLDTFYFGAIVFAGTCLIDRFSVKQWRLIYNLKVAGWACLAYLALRLI